MRCWRWPHRRWRGTAARCSAIRLLDPEALMRLIVYYICQQGLSVWVVEFAAPQTDGNVAFPVYQLQPPSSPSCSHGCCCC
eukprot:5280344-Pyramimonas_sp.AAC.1